MGLGGDGKGWSAMGRGAARLGVLGVLGAGVLAGCGSAGEPTPAAEPSRTSPPSTGVTADCALAVRLEGSVYVERGSFSAADTTRAGTADLAECDDMGVDPRGAYFPDDARSVTVWAFDGFDPRLVLGLRTSGEALRVLVAQDVPAALAEDLTRALARSRPVTGR